MNLILFEAPHLELHLSCSQISIPIRVVYKIQEMKTRINSYLHLYAF
jgi:hypothetical protein